MKADYKSMYRNQSGIAHILLILFLLVSIAIGIFLVTSKNPFQTKSKASSSEVLDAFEFTDKDGNKLNCFVDTDNQPTCDTPTLDINVAVKNKDALRPQQ